MEHVEEIDRETAVFLMMSSRNSMSEQKTKILIVLSSKNSKKIVDSVCKKEFEIMDQYFENESNHAYKYRCFNVRCTGNISALKLKTSKTFIIKLVYMLYSLCLFNLFTVVVIE